VGSPAMTTDQLMQLVVGDIRTIATHYGGDHGIRLAQTALSSLPLWDIDGTSSPGANSTG
jgi:hypothetical protein